jgi:hypothetical protein
MAAIAEERLRGDAEQTGATTHVEHLEARFLRDMQLQQRLKNADDVRPFGVREFSAATIVLARNEPEIPCRRRCSRSRGTKSLSSSR